MAPTAPVNGNGAAPAPVQNESVLSSINEIIDTDDEMYDAGDSDVAADDGGLDTGDRGGDTGFSPVPVPNGQSAAPSEPELPMELPNQQPPQQRAYDPENPRGYNRVGHLFADEKGNIVTRDGRVMAASGEAARHWSNMSKAASESVTLKRQNEALTQQIERNSQLINAAKELSELPQRLGISREEYNLGVQLVSNWNKNPLDVCRDMVARTMARGFNATDILGKEAGNAIEMSALRTMLNEATADQRQRAEMDRTVAEQRRTAEAGYNAFIAKYPDAHNHSDVIANLMRDKKLSATEAYHELRFFALQEGFDFNFPLGPQMQAKAARMQQPQQQRPQVPNRQTQRAPMVAGNGGGNRDHLTTETQYADANASWGDILNSVMRQSA